MRETLTPEQQRLLDTEGKHLREMMLTEGWKVLCRLFKSTVERHDSIHGIKTLKEMLAKQEAVAMMNEWMEAIIQRTSLLEHKAEIARQVHERKSMSGLVTVAEEEER